MNNFIGYIMEDKAGNLWISCGVEGGMALYKYTPSAVYGEKDGPFTEIKKYLPVKFSNQQKTKTEIFGLEL
ncbi:MAG: hypothetical protein IPJ32_12345 [Sphingobacteriaceae bacterium]|nr:hypothetical protein [Sphingobacteriaceae bacterium]